MRVGSGANPPSDIDATRHARAVLKLPSRRLRADWLEVRITILAESGFCRWRMMRWCDSNGIGYVLGLARNVVLQRQARDWIERTERQSGRTGVPHGSTDGSPTRRGAGTGPGG
jgi:hypothetical protein